MKQIKTSVVNAQDEIPTVRPPRPASASSSANLDGMKSAPPPMSLWQLARQVMRAEASEALIGATR